MAKNESSRSDADRPTLPIHGAQRLPSVDVDSYSLELEDEKGYAGDKANKGAFVRILDEIRTSLRESGEDPLGSKPSRQISRKKLGEMLVKGDPEAGALVQSAVEDFAQQFVTVIRRFLKLKSWQGTECIVVGGGFRASRIGELAIARTGIILKTEGVDVGLQLLKNDPDEAALIGTAHLLPAWMIEGHDAILAADIGGTNIRAGIVELNLSKAKDLSKARVPELKHWCHQEEQELKRDAAVERLAQMLTELLREAKDKVHFAPVIGIGCPGVIAKDGAIERGAHNLPGNWESETFNLPRAIQALVPRIGEHETSVVMHNDAVVQGLSEVPHMRGHEHWGILTIGTGLGNARFSNRQTSKDKR
jgi:hypothetical protein